MVIHKWRKRPTHVLQDVQQLYGKLLHACTAVPHGKAYLTSLEEMLSYCGAKPFMLHRPGKHVAEDLEWWSLLLQSGGVKRTIYPALALTNPLAFSDTSSGIGIAIVIGNHWRAWRLIPGWQTTNGKRDIGWAEAVGFELLIYTLATLSDTSRNFLVHGDNTGIVEGWWKRRHRNRAVNSVFKRINQFISSLSRRLEITTTYVASAANPADDPSRGIYGSSQLLLPPVRLPDELNEFIIDSTAPLSPTELRQLRAGKYSAPAAKFINRQLIKQEAEERTRAAIIEEEQFIFSALHEE
jgi:hypothetical protein